MNGLITLVCACLTSVALVYNVVTRCHSLDGNGAKEDLNREDDLLLYLDRLLYLLLVFIPVVIVVGLGYVLVKLFSRALTRVGNMLT